jgi:hypothetical protein
MMRRNRSDVTDSPAFRRWFRKSKVVGVDGRPLVVYHGSPRDFDVFNIRPDASGKAIFAEREDVAASYENRGFDVGDGIYDVYLRIENPLVVDAQGANWDEIEPAQLSPEVRRYLSLDRLDDYASTDSIMFAARGLGYDGAIIKNVVDWYNDVVDETNPETTVYAVFSPYQIKAATGNAGTFDPDDPSILRNPRLRRKR